MKTLKFNSYATFNLAVTVLSNAGINSVGTGAPMTISFGSSFDQTRGLAALADSQIFGSESFKGQADYQVIETK